MYVHLKKSENNSTIILTLECQGYENDSVCMIVCHNNTTEPPLSSLRPPPPPQFTASALNKLSSSSSSSSWSTLGSAVALGVLLVHGVSPCIHFPPPPPLSRLPVLLYLLLIRPPTLPTSTRALFLLALILNDPIIALALVQPGLAKG